MRRPRHAYLREATKAAHQDLERAVERAGFFAVASGYSDYMLRLRLFHDTFRRNLRANAGDLLNRWGFDEFAKWLDEDLASLTLTPLPLSAAHAFRQTPSHNASVRLGAFYVVLGSTLGAKVLLKRAQSLSLPQGRGLAYLTRMGRSEGWQQYLEYLETAPGVAEEDLSFGAVATFESIQDHMAGAIVP